MRRILFQVNHEMIVTCLETTMAHKEEVALEVDFEVVGADHDGPQIALS